MEAAMSLDLPRTLTPAGRRVLDAAAELFYREGIHAVGVDAIASAAGVTKKTLYACFGSKDRLVAAYLWERDQRWRQWLTEWVESHGGPPRDRLLGTLDALAGWIEREDPRGCGFINALAELPSREHQGHAIIVGQKQWLLSYLTELASCTAAADPARLGRTMLLLHEGVTIAAATGIVEAPTQDARATADALIPE
jgi:AcrR family transcriptional regulator